MQKAGRTVEDTEMLIAAMSEAECRAILAFVRSIIGHIWFFSLFMRRLKKSAAESQERRYRDGYVFYFVEGTVVRLITVSIILNAPAVHFLKRRTPVNFRRTCAPSMQ